METKNKVFKASNINGILLIIFEILVLGGVQFAVAPLTSLFAEEGTDKFEAVSRLLGFSLQYLIGVALPLFIFYRTSAGRELSKREPLFVKPKMPWSWVIRFIFISFFLIYTTTIVFNLLFNLIQTGLDVKFQPVDFSADKNALSRMTNVLAMMFFAPFFEELLFRGTFVRNSCRYGGWHTIIATGILFGLWHMNYEQTFATAAFGICTAFLYVKTRSILPSMLLHFCFNTLGTIQSFIVDPEFKNKLTSGNAMELMVEDPTMYTIVTLLGFVVIGLIVAGLVIFVLELNNHPDSFKLEKDNEEENEISEGKKLGVYFSAPATLIVAAALLVMTVLRGAGVF